MAEDCLHLNIFVPSSLVGDHCHVMVYIHGGGHVTGDATSALPTDLVADYGVIVVTLNYRLGYLGFLSTADAAAPGNNGLRDQVMAIQWVKDNIWAFGGNSSDITVFGHGSGASSASLLSLSPMSNGLFQKVIMMSGTAVAPWALVSKERSIENFQHLAMQLGCYPWWCTYFCYETLDLHYRVLDCFRQKEALDFDPYPLIESPGDGRFFGHFENLYAGPTCDGIFVPNTPELLLRNLTYLENNGVSSREYISGTTNEEALDAVNNAMMNHAEHEQFLTSHNMRMLAQDAAKFLYPTCTSPEVVNLIDFLYSYPRERGPEPKLHDYVDLVTDALYTYPSLEFLTMLAETSPSTNIFMYLFNYYPDIKQNETEFYNETIGTANTYDLLYFFDHIDSVNDTAGHIDLNTTSAQKMMEVYRGTLAAFAKTGNPSLPGTAWPRFDEGCRRYLSIEPEPKEGKRVFPQRMSLWQDYLPKVVENLPSWG